MRVHLHQYGERLAEKPEKPHPSSQKEHVITEVSANGRISVLYASNF